MARVHFWKFLVNEAGEPIESANISITLAGTDTPVWVYFDEFSSTGKRDVPQLSTIKNGYFEFWIDEDEDFDPEGTVDNVNGVSYGFNQKFKLSWEKTGIATGTIDYIDIFPPSRFFEKVNETDPTSTYKNKVVSNYLAWYWTTHADQDAREEGTLPIHGFELANSLEPNDTPNKIITNQMAWNWDTHVGDTIETYNLSAGPPHGLRPYVEGSIDTTWEVVVNDALITNLLAATKAALYLITVPLSGGDFEWEVDVDDRYFTTILHELNTAYPHVTCYNESTGVMVKSADVVYVDNDNIQVYIDEEPFNMKVRITA